MLAHGIAIQYLGSIPETAQAVQEFFAERGFSRGTQTCQPDYDGSPPGTAKLVRRTVRLYCYSMHRLCRQYDSFCTSKPMFCNFGSETVAILIVFASADIEQML